MDYQDLLARQGAGSAHPGGFSATLDFLKHFPIPRGTKVLEVGCGTGRTACHLARRGCHVTAVDIRPAMLQKARNRAMLERVPVRLLEGDACQLPLDSGSFDLVLVESVTVFTDVTRSIPEYYRVLKPGGRLYDREMLATKKHPKRVTDNLHKFYGVKQIPTSKKWMALLRSAHFRETGIWRPTAVPKDLSVAAELMHPDIYQQTDADLPKDPGYHHMVEQNSRLMAQYADYLGYGVLLGVK